MSTLLTNADFARAVGVTPARVSQWKSEGKITAAALISQDGRTLIDAERACEDLGRRLDLSQMTGNGAATRLGGFFDGARDDQSGPLVVAPGGEQAVHPGLPESPADRVDQAAGQLRRGVAEEDVVSYLVDIEANYMGLRPARGAAARAKEVVAAIQADEELWIYPD